MQIVYLSARPDVLAETLGHVRHYAPFIDNVVVVVPERLAEEISSLGLVDTVLTDEECTGRSTGYLTSLEHTSRNYLLRTKMVQHESIVGTFIMSDDDSRPLVPIDQSTFIDAEGRHRRRWFHTMEAWRYTSSEFDESILNTWIILRQMGFEQPLSYASHMPQIIDKSLYAQVADRFVPWADRYALEEWSTYFTVAPSIMPERFAEPEPFGTLGWPQYPGEWAHQITPPRHIFENHHPELHQEGGLYDGLPSECNPGSADATNMEKIVRWYRLDRQVRQLAFPEDVDEPWTADSSSRKLAFKGLKMARNAYRYVALDDRARITELEGRIQRMEPRQDSPG